MDTIIKINLKGILKTGLYAGLISATVNIILFFLFKGLDILSDSVFITHSQPLTVLPVMIASFVSSIIGSVILYFLLRYTNNGMYIFSIITMVLVLISLFEPFIVIKNITLLYGVALGMMHVIVAVILYQFHKATLEEL
jgi:hypothetical protein